MSFKDFRQKKDRKMNEERDFSPQNHRKSKLKPQPKDKYRLRANNASDNEEDFDLED